MGRAIPLFFRKISRIGSLISFRLVTVAVAAFAMLLLAPLAYSQSQFATLSGTVVDPSGAVIPGANVTVKPSHSQDVRKSVTNSDGFFSMPALPSGTYEVSVEVKGFLKWRGTDIVLNASDSRTMKIELKLGSSAETVEVTASVTELATTDSGEKSALISSDDLEHLSLVGRNAAEYLKILPGATLFSNYALNGLSDSGETVAMGQSPVSVSGQIGNVNINGQSADITQDGQRVADTGKGTFTPVNPNPDMISEVKVLTSNFSAENAKGPVVMNSVTKGGTSAFHGSAYLYARNSALNATEHHNLVEHVPNPKTPSSYYFPGFNVGGPVIIPGTDFNKSRKKLFFFDGFEYYKQHIDVGVARAYVPSADMLNGDFSSLIGYGGPEASSYLYGVPTTPQPCVAGNDSHGNYSTCLQDPNVNVPFQGQNVPSNGWWALGGGPDNVPSQRPGCQITGGVLNSACISPAAQILLKNVVPAANANPATNNGFNFVQAYSEPNNNWQNMTREDWSISDNTKVYVTWSRQRETQNWPVGLWVTAGDNMVPTPSPIQSHNSSDAFNGTFVHVFSPTMTIEARAGFMKSSLLSAPENLKKFTRAGVGYPLHGIFSDTNIPAISSWTSSFPNMGDVGYDYHPTVQDSQGIPSAAANLTKVVKTHTLKAGFYYEHAYNNQDNWQQYQGTIEYGPWVSWAGSATGNEYADLLMGIGMATYEQQGPPTVVNVAQNIASFYGQDDWKVTRRLTINYGLRFEHYPKPYNSQFGMAVFNPAKYDPSAAPNVNTGVAWHASDSSVPSNGSSVPFFFYSPRIGGAFDVFGNSKTVLRGGWGKYRAFDAFQSRNYTDPAGTAMGIVYWGNCGTNNPNCPTLESIDNYAYTPVLGKPALQNTGFTAESVNNHETPLVNAYSFTVDQALPNKFKAEISYVGNTGKYTQWAANANAVPLGALFNYACPAGTGNVTDPGCQQTVRPYKLYQGITQVRPFGKSRFDSLQASLIRYMGWLSLQANYTFSKNLGDNQLSEGALPDWGAKELYGYSTLNRTHAFSAAYVFTLPKTHSASSFVRGALNNWQISGITQISSGPQLNAQSAYFNWSQLSPVTLMGTPDIQLAPLITCNPRSNLGKNQYLNPNCFTAPSKGQTGTLGMPYIPGPWYWNSDLTLLKQFKIGERQGLQFRLAAFNFLNSALPSFSGSYTARDNNLTANFNDLGQTITGTSCPTTSGGVRCTQPSTFGTTDTYYGQRKLELGVKYTF
ncbi:MAG TPA: carboxypeptidase regulatory-like domain-containing protein [Dongiaceae bacterium]|nr:carboxypeptidase regulatory-like domain-containing protein [Dongiaceae bacterium]